MIQAAAPVMKQKGYNRIVGFASVQGTVGHHTSRRTARPRRNRRSDARGHHRTRSVRHVREHRLPGRGRRVAFGPIASRLVGPSVNVAPRVA
jgi:hypothetical protein